MTLSIQQNHVVAAIVRGCEEAELNGDWVVRDTSGEIMFRDLDGAVALCGELTDDNRCANVEYVVRYWQRGELLLPWGDDK